MSPYEQNLAHICYEHYKTSGSREFTYQAQNGNDMVHASNAISSMEEEGFLSEVTDHGFSYSFIIEDSLIRYMEQEEF